MSARGFETGSRLLDLAAKAGGEATVTVRESDAGHVRFAAGEITTSGEVSTTTATLTLAFGRRHAKAETNQVADPAALRSFVERTAALAKIAPDDPEYVPPLGPQRYAENPRTWDEVTSSLAPAERASRARTAIDTAGAKGLVAAGFVESHAEALTFATSSGLRAQHRGTVARMTTTARTKDGAGSGWAGADRTSALEVDANELARVATDKAERSRNASKLDPGRYTVILEPAAVGDLLAFLLEALDARAADQGRSFFSHAGGGNRIGESIFDPRVVLRSDPFDPLTPDRPWDADGMPLRPTTWIEGGRLASLYYPRFWAQKMGKPFIGSHGAYHLTCPSGAPSAANLAEGVRRGLLVTRFWYIRWLDPKQLLVTGLTRDGVWLVEDGKITRPVNNFRFNESPVKMLTRLVGMTAVTYRVPTWGGVMRVPVVCCDDFEMSSVSDAV
jgi:predicted Zn-dependent protease